MHMYCVWWCMNVIPALRRLRVRLGSGFSEGTGLIGWTCIRDLLIWITGCGPDNLTMAISIQKGQES